jgi:quercetin 2,3-dioxygenase
MGKVKTIQQVLRSKPTIEDAGVHWKRVFGFHQAPNLDPFLLLDDFHSDTPADYLSGFPWHPHRGIETITYVLHGEIEHGDSLGNTGVITPGDVQWMTAGSGIIHQEMPRETPDGLLWGFQLWANLPASHKMMTPRYRDITGDQIPQIERTDGTRIQIICGTVDGVEGPARDIITNPTYLDIHVPPATRFTYPVNAGETLLAYVIEGRACFDPERNPFGYVRDGENYFDFERQCETQPESLIVFTDGDTLQVDTESEPVRFLLIAGKPLREPVAWAGPIVMNTQEELRVAFDEYRRGAFLKHGAQTDEG